MSTTTTIELEPIHVRDHPVPSIQSKPRQDVEVLPQRIKVETKGTTTIIITTITGVNFVSALLAGIVTISLPVMAKDLEISESLMLWPTSIYSLTCGCTLILAGAVADVTGPRNMYLLGAFLQSVFTLACGLSKTAAELIVFRALAGIAISFCLPSAVSLVMMYFQGRRRNIAFGAMGGGQPLGFTLGLICGGALTDRVGWSVGFYLAAGVNSLLFLLALFGLPKTVHATPLTWSRLRSDVDWIGALILSTALALLLYVFATWTGNIANIRSVQSISCLSLGLVLLLAFALWAHRREKSGQTVLIRNSLWRNKAFTSICINVFLIWGAFNATETFLAFLFQDVQGLSASAASIRFLPEPVMGASVNVLMGLYVHRMQATWALLFSFVASGLSPLLLAVMRQSASYWEFIFPAVFLIPISADVLYTMSQLIITAEFDENTQALAGGVFNTVAQIGKSVGLALSAIVANGVSVKASSVDSHKGHLLEGYRAAWWFCMAATSLCIIVTLLGLRNIGKVGIKKD